MRGLFLSLCLLFLSTAAQGEVFLNAQHAGYAGEAAVGLGYAGSSFGADLLYGWTPKSLAGHEVRSFTGKGLWYLFAIGDEAEVMLRPYFGLAVIYNPNHELFVKLPEQYPDSYYVPSALRPAFLTGLRLQVNTSVSASLEYALLDSELAYVRNKGGIAYDRVGSVGFGLHWAL